MLKTFLLLLPMLFNTQATTIQAQADVPEMQSYCVVMQVHRDPYMPEYATSGISANSYNVTASEGTTNSKNMNTYPSKRNGYVLPSTNGSDMSSNNGNSVSDRNVKTEDKTISEKNNADMNNRTDNVIDRNSNKYPTQITNDNKTVIDNNNGNNNFIIDDNDNELYSSYNEAYDALRTKFDSMFSLESRVDELRRELNVKETELYLYRDLYTQRLKALVEKWNKD